MTRPEKPEPEIATRSAPDATVKHIALITLTVLVVTLACLLYLSKHGTTEHWLLDGPWDDGRTFFTIARDGYSPEAPQNFRELIFYPLVLRIFLPITGICALLIVSVLSAVGSSILVYLIGCRWYLSAPAAFFFAIIFSVARLPTFFVAFFVSGFPPMTVLVSVQGSESLYLALCLGSFYAFKEDRLDISFFLVGLASVTRITGLIVAAGFAFCLLLDRRWRSVFWVLFPALLLGLHFLYFLNVGGDFFAFFKGHGQFYSEGTLTYPFHDLVMVFSSGNHIFPWETQPGWVVNYLFSIIGLIYLARRDRLLFWISAPSFLLFVSLNGWALHARYYVTLWAIPFAYALWLTDNRTCALKRLRSGPQPAEATGAESGQRNEPR